MNRFGREVFQHMAIDTSQPLQTREFIGSYTSILRNDMSDEAAADLCKRIHLDPDTFTAEIRDEEVEL